jgi:signal peptidase I
MTTEKIKPLPKSALRENIESILWAVAIALLIRTFIVAPFKIPSGSMQPTLLIGDRILVNKFIYRFREPRRGEVIVFRYPEDPKRPFIKRLIAIAKDKVEIKDGRIFINDTALDPSIARASYYYNQGEFGREGKPIVVPEGMYFVLGDNSGSSHDSRFWGYVPRKLVIGKAMCIFWPPWRIMALR